MQGGDGKRFGPGVAVVGAEGGQQFLIFRRQNGAGAIEQAAAGFQRRPERFQQLPLHPGELLQIQRRAQETNVRMAAQHAGAGAGRVEQNGIEGLAVPPVGRPAGVGGFQRCPLAEALEIFRHPLQPGRVAVQGQQLGARGQFEQMAGFATRGGAGVENAFTVLGLEQGGAPLGAGVLDAGPAALELGQLGQRRRRLQRNRPGVQRVGPGAGLAGAEFVPVQPGGQAQGEGRRQPVDVGNLWKFTAQPGRQI